MARHTLARLPSLLVAASLAACSASHAAEPAPSGTGVCCPITDFSGCSPGAEPLPAGGWAADESACTRTIAGFDGRPFERVVDGMGCPVVREAESGCCGCVADAGLDAGSDASVDPCAGLPAAACFASTACAPVFDDACCPSCTDGPCADCTDYVYVGCEPFEGCRDACGVSVPWACFPAAPDCAGAFAVDEDSCSRPGCVPLIASSETPSPMGSCTAITAESCTVGCRAAPPECPEGAVAEADGSCWTGWCIPAFVCE